MKAAFDLAVCYLADARCVTPLRTAGADSDTQSVLRDSRGRAFLQGTSLAGALRDWLAQNSGSRTADALFGSPRVPGSLIVSDGIFDAAAEQQTRPRVRIDPPTGAAADGGKFDVAHISAGSLLRFSLTWLGPRDRTDELLTVEAMLAALNAGDIRLGAQKTTGFGRVSLSVRKRVFDMADEKDRQAWLANDMSGAGELALPAAPRKNTVTFTLSGRAGNLLVKAAAPVSEDGRSYTPNISENGVCILPGSSIKGTVRGRAAAIARAAGLPEQTVEGLFGRGAKGSDNGLAGHVIFQDVLLKSAVVGMQPRIRIDRFTGGVIRKGLFWEKPVSGGVELCITAPEEPVGCALLLYALRDLGLGLYSLGGGSNIGHGYLSVDAIRIQAPDGRSAALSFSGGGCSLEDGDGLVGQWLGAWEDAKDEDR